MALRFTTMPDIFTRMEGPIGRVSAAIRASVILAVTLTAGCGVPSVTNVTPERVVTGEASATAGTQFQAGGEPVAIAITPGGSNLYAANLLDGTISAFTVQSTGSLAAVGGSPFQTGLHPVALCITSNGRFLYVAGSGGQNVSGFAISAGGALTQAGTPSPAGFSPLSVARMRPAISSMLRAVWTTAFQRFASTCPLAC
jgi:DNA-binding beta-propeller fold protein YncE